MNDINKNENIAAETDEQDYLLVFSKPYTFECEVCDSVDLSGLEDLSAKDMIAAEKYTRRVDPSITILVEMSVPYAQFIASRASNKPIEFFTGLSPKDTIKLKNTVTGFLYGSD